MKKFLILVAVLALGALAYYEFVLRPGQEELTKPAPAFLEPREDNAAPSSPPDSSAGTTQPGIADTGEGMEPSEPLPPLIESDPAVLEALTGVIGESAVSRYVIAENLVPRIVVTVDSLTARQLPGQQLPIQPPDTPFEANVQVEPGDEITNDQGDVLKQFETDPVNAGRYTAYVELLESFSTADMVKLYERYQPLFEEAYVGLGYPEGGFHQRLLDVIDHLLAAGPAPESMRLIKPEAYYLFVDPDLESLTAGQKLMVRMGSDNALRVKEKLTQLRAELDEAPPEQPAGSEPVQQ